MSVIARSVRYPRRASLAALVKWLGVAVIAAAAAIGGAGEARAATDVRVTGTTLRVDAAAARANQITVFDAGSNVRVRDLTDIVVPGAGCVFVDSHTADCPRAGISQALAIARDMDDSALTFSSVPINLYGQDGADTLRGGTGNDHLDGGTGPDLLFGDTGEDRTTDAAKPAGVTVTLDGVANDGVVNEGDNVSPTIENITGSRFDDRILGSPSPNVIDGGLGNDRLWGFDGADTFTTPRLDGADEYNGGPGVDHVTYTRRPDRVIVQLDGAANDGDPVAAEGDNVRLDVEQVTGGIGSSTGPLRVTCRSTITGTTCSASPSVPRWTTTRSRSRLRPASWATRSRPGRAAAATTGNGPFPSASQPVCRRKAPADSSAAGALPHVRRPPPRRAPTRQANFSPARPPRDMDIPPSSILDGGTSGAMWHDLAGDQQTRRGAARARPRAAAPRPRPDRPGYAQPLNVEALARGARDSEDAVVRGETGDHTIRNREAGSPSRT